jgi:hypothetical protein
MFVTEYVFNFILGVSELLLFTANSAIFQLYHDENKLIFNEMNKNVFNFQLLSSHSQLTGACDPDI